MSLFMEDVYKSALILAFTIITLVYIYYKYKFLYWRRKGIEEVPASIPFGSASKLVLGKSSIGELMREVYDKYKPKKLRYVGFSLFSQPVLVILDVNLIKSIFTKDFRHFTDRATYSNEKDEPLTGHLFNLKGERWRHARTKLTPTFTSGKMKMMFHILVECSNGLKEIMDDIVKEGKTTDIKDAVARYTTDVIGSCAFGLDCKSMKDPNSDFIKYGKKFFDLGRFEAFVRFLSVVSPDIIATLHLKIFNKGLSNFMMNVVKDTVNYREKNNVKRSDFMHLLIQLKNNVQLKEDENLGNLRNTDGSTGKDSFTIEQIAAHSLVFFVAGFETSATTLTFCLYELSLNQDIQKKLRTEIRSVLAEHNNNITYEALSQMKYLDKCVNETLRKYPPVPALTRKCTETYKIPESDDIIEKDTVVFISVLGMQRDPEHYPNPLLFDPERFSVENSTQRHPFAWIPFGEGPRLCIGMRFGIMQTKLALAALLRDYSYTLNNKTKTPVVMNPRSITLAAKDGIWLNVEKAK